MSDKGRRRLDRSDSMKRRTRLTKRARWYSRQSSRSSITFDDDVDSITGVLGDDCPDTPIDGPLHRIPEEDQGFQVHRTNSFRKKVRKKSRMYLIGELEAEVEVIVDLLIAQQGGLDKALLHVVAQLYIEIKVKTYVTMLLHRGARPVAMDSQHQTALHHAVKRNFDLVARKLLEANAGTDVRDADGNTPYNIALLNQNDDIASMLLVFMPNKVARELYTASADNPAELCFQQLLQSGMQKTVLSLLDCMLVEAGPSDHYRVFYNILEADELGRPPDHHLFKRSSHSALHLIAHRSNKAVVYHDVVRLLIRRKWKEYAKWRFELNAMLYLLALFSLTYSAIIGSAAEEPMEYKNPIHYSRAVFEGYVIGMAAFTFLIELNQIRKHRLDYWKDPFNCVDIGSVCLLLAVIPLRYKQLPEQWPVFSIGYLLWVFRIFKYAAVFRQTGAYAQILWKIVSQDFVQFTVVFGIVLLAFSGSFLLAVRGEGLLTNHSDTSFSFWEILFMGTRTLIEAQPVVEYTGSEGYRGLYTALMVVFLLICIVVLLNILIAQLSDTYQNIQGDAQRALELNRAWIVTRVERNSIFVGAGYRVTKYVESETVVNPEEVLEHWENAPVNDSLKSLRELRDRIDIQDLNLRTVKTRLARQEHALAGIREQLQDVSNLLLLNQFAGFPPSRQISREGMRTLHRRNST